MPILSTVESRSFRGRLTHVTIIVLLSLGGLTMVYPFLIMVSGSVRSDMDVQALNLVPAYLVHTKPLYRKFLETKYNQDPAALNRDHRQHNYSFRQAHVPDKAVTQRIADIRQFVHDHPIPDHWWVLGGVSGYKTVPENLRKMRSMLGDRFHGDLTALGRNLGAPIDAWNLVIFTSPQWLSQRFNYHSNAIYDAYFKLLHESPLAQRDILSISGYFVQAILAPKYGQATTAAYNHAHVHHLDTFGDFVLPRTVPGKDQPTLRREWLEYVDKELNPAFVLLEGVSEAHYRAFLQKRHGNIADLNHTWSTHYVDYQAIDLPHGQWLSGAEAQDYLAFLKTVDPSHYQLTGFEYAWRDWLKAKYHGDIAALNQAQQTQYASFAQVHVPLADVEYQYVTDHAGSLRWAYATRNYINVIDEMVLHGNALLNSAIFCALAILVALLVNPLGAYAMSRFRLPGTYKTLLILMATMAFPPMVTMIPTFIMLRKLSLLNTFAALILPFAANGYLIFLLKGFFDSLPQELYEAGRIDGASELRMFFQLTMALSKPILAWVALMAFTSAYTMFLYPLVVCPQPDMWIISVWLYQYQQQASTAAVYASVLIASIPTLVVFLFAQRTIMRGIVVPVEK